MQGSTKAIKDFGTSVWIMDDTLLNEAIHIVYSINKNVPQDL